MEIIIKISSILRNKIVADLNREHPFTHERVGVALSRCIRVGDLTIVFLYDYVSLDDDHYDQYKYGAQINSKAIRYALEKAFEHDCGLFHVHMHRGKDRVPGYSSIDLEGIPPLIESFRNAKRNEVHGSLLLNLNEANAMVLAPGSEEILDADKIISIGRPLQVSLPKLDDSTFSEKFSRQSFLGTKSEMIFESLRIGVVGLGGGGSHIIQQLAHLGFKSVVAFDYDRTDVSNLNRMVGATRKDADEQTLKTAVAERLYKGVEPLGTITPVNARWEEKPNLFASCDIVIGGVDFLLVRRDLENHSRRFLIPYIDIGMDVTETTPGQFVIGGQVILSLPGKACMKCLSFLRDNALEAEGKRYGDAGENPQVIWSNGVLASTAIGLLVEICTGWSKAHKDGPEYLMYDGNANTLTEDPRLKLFGKKVCDHFSLKEVGPVKIFKI